MKKNETIVSCPDIMTSGEVMPVRVRDFEFRCESFLRMLKVFPTHWQLQKSRYK
jgi:hypothetical protein